MIASVAVSGSWNPGAPAQALGTGRRDWGAPWGCSVNDSSVGSVSWSVSCPAWLPGWAASLTQASKEVSKSGLPRPLAHPGTVTAVLFSAEGDPPSRCLGEAGALGKMLCHPCQIKSPNPQRILHLVSFPGHCTVQPPMCLHCLASSASHSAPSRQAV